MKKRLENKNESISTDQIVVGIGASAGGLEALQDFFKAMPVDSGLAFVVIQHLSPDYKSLMDELLSRQTSMKIFIAEDNMPVLPNTIYLIPPRKNLTLFHDQLFLENQNLRKGLNLPVDIFFRSLAKEKGKNAIGIILSGTGSDGTLGTRAIKEAGGMIMAQDEQSAKFNGMPKSSIATGLVDYILPPDKMTEELVNYIKHPFVKKDKPLDSVLTKNFNTLTKIILILRDFSGIDFSYYKENTIIRRLERRVSINRFDNLEDYLLYLSDSDKEKDSLYRDLLIGVTRFFRDSEAFESLKEKVLPELFEGKDALRIWSTGCSTGEEVYSLAIILKEFISKNKIDCEIKIFATDIDKIAIEQAGVGYYPDSIVADIEPALINKYFIRRENGYQVNETIRKMIVFATHNLIKDPPFSKLDLIICRNLFIYLKPEIQYKLLSSFYLSLNENGFLFLGSSESIGDMSSAFESIDQKWKIYRYMQGYKTNILKELPLIRSESQKIGDLILSKTRFNDGVRFEKLFDSVLSSYMPPSVIIDQNENIVHTINDVSEFVKIQPGKFSNNLINNLPPELALFVSANLRKLKKNEKHVVLENVVGLKGFKNANISIEGKALKVDKNYYYIFSFIKNEASKSSKKKVTKIDINSQNISRISDLEKELQFTKESLQATVEELETSNEELQSSNEELIASNEELQSTNEELQSVNEELYTVNSEYQNKIEELTNLNNDVNNLLKNTEVGAIYLDANLCLRKITPLVSKITNILPSDIGRPISHITVMDCYISILNDVKYVNETLQPIDKEITTPQGVTYFSRIRPYRTEVNSIEGILITFVDISQLKKEARRADLAIERLGNALKVGNMAWWEWDIASGEVIYDSRKATMLGYTVDEFPKDVYEICNLIHQDDYEKTMQIMRDHLEGRTETWETNYRIKRKDGSYAWFYDRGKITTQTEDGKPAKISGAVIEVSKLKSLEEELKFNRLLFENILDNGPYAYTMVDKNGEITYANKKAEEIFGITRDEMRNLSYDASLWNITDIQGNPIPSEKLPFALVKESKKLVFGYRHFIQLPGKEKLLLNINGTPLFNQAGEFESVVFAIGVEDHGEE